MIAVTASQPDTTALADEARSLISNLRLRDKVLALIEDIGRQHTAAREEAARYVEETRARAVASAGEFEEKLALRRRQAEQDVDARRARAEAGLAESEQRIAVLATRREAIDTHLTALREALAALAGPSQQDLSAVLETANQALADLDRALQPDGDGTPRRGRLFRRG